MKKGVIDLSSEQVMWVMHAIFLALIVIVILWYSGLFIKSDVNIRDLESNLLMLRLSYSDSCFAYSSIRVFPGIIDIEKFNEHRLKNCLSREDYLIGAKLKYDDKNLEIFNSKKFKEKEGFCKFIEKFYCKEEKQYVLIRDNDKFKGGFLNIKVIANA